MMSQMEVNDSTPQKTALNIGSALAYLEREAKAAGLDDLASQIGTLEASAYDAARQTAYLNV